jgi:hypothetical protein
VRLSFLNELYKVENLSRRPGPYCSVYLDTTRATSDALHAIQVRWRDLADVLRQSGAPAADLDALNEVVPELRGEGRVGHAVFATGGEVVLAAELAGPPPRDIARFGPLPHTMPLIAQVPETVPHVLVVVDRVGADVSAVGHGQHVEREVTGDTYPIRKVRAGGWSERRYQQRAEDTWERNAARVARAVTESANACRAEVVLVAGEERAVAELLDAFGDDLRAEIVEVGTGGRAPGIDEEAFRAQVRKLLEERVAARLAATLETFRAELGRRRHAADGLAASVAALQRAEVATLLVSENASDPDAETKLFIGPEPTHLALTRDELTAFAVAEPVEERADAALVRAAAGTDAELVVVPEPEQRFTDGVGAVLRFGPLPS